MWASAAPGTRQRTPSWRMADHSKRPPGEALVDLRRRLALLSPRDPARSEVIARAAEAYVYRRAMMYGPTRNQDRFPAHIS